MKKGLLIVLSGPSGAGKGTILKKVFENGGNYELSVSVTTRAPRVGEVDGINYHFKTMQEVEQMIANDEFLEYMNVFGNVYGTSKKFVQEKLEAGKNVILEIDTKGALKVKQIIPEAIMIFIVPKDLATLKARLVGRGTETAEQVERRFGEAVSEIEKATQYDYLLINEEIETCAKQFEAIISAEQCKVACNENIIKSFF